MAVAFDFILYNNSSRSACLVASRVYKALAQHFPCTLVNLSLNPYHRLAGTHRLAKVASLLWQLQRGRASNLGAVVEVVGLES